MTFVVTSPSAMSPILISITRSVVVWRVRTQAPAELPSPVPLDGMRQ